MVGKVNHNILELEVSVDDKYSHHIVETMNKLLHDHMDNLRVQLVLFVFHDFLQIGSIAELHEDVISGIGLYCFAHFDHIFALDSILVLNFTHNKALFYLAELLALDDFAGEKFRIWVQS
jgi:hypothetical protein